MKPREDDIEKEDRRERFERRRGQGHADSDFIPPRKRREPYKREHFTQDDSWDEDDEWFDDNN